MLKEIVPGVMINQVIIMLFGTKALITFQGNNN